MRNPILLAAALALLASSARAGTIDVDSTTLLNVARQTRAAPPGQDFALADVAPAFQILSITARDLRNPLADDLTIVLSTWGSYDFQDRRWDNGTNHDLTGDVVTLYAQGKLLDRHVTLRLGRAQVQTGVARMIHLDGAQAIGLLPGGFRVSGYVGVPVSQRFATWSGYRSWNPVGGDLAYGGRLGWSLAIPGIAGRGLDIGASANVVEDAGDPVRQELGADLRLRPIDPVTLTAFAAYSVYDERVSEGTVRLGWTPARRLLVEADYRFVAPDLLLSRNSILSVFTDEERQFVGGGLTYQVGRGLRVGGSYHLQLEPDARGRVARELGHAADARIEWERGGGIAGAEAFYLDSFDNGYVGGRLFGRKDVGRAFAAVDGVLHVFREKVNGEDLAVTGTLSAGYRIVRGLSAVVAGRGGTTPFLEQTFDVIAKLVYEETYRKTEVR